MKSRKRIVVVGGSFGGVNAAYELRRRLPRDAEITVISRDADFTFIPSLPWVIMGWRDPSRLQVRLRSEEHTSELQSQSNLVCRLLLEKKKKHAQIRYPPHCCA